MALPKRQLKERLQEAGCEESKIDEVTKWILDGSSASVEAVKEQLAEAMEKVDQYNALVAERDELKSKLAKAGDAAKVQKDFDDYKAMVEGEKTATAKRNALDAVLKEAGISRDSFRRAVAKDFDLSSIELDDGGRIKTADDIIKTVGTDYKDFVSTTQVRGTEPNNPPPSSGGSMTKAEILQIKDTSARQQAIAENIGLFQPGAQ